MTQPASSSTGPAWTASDLGDDPHRASDKAERVQSMFTAIARRYDLNNRVHSFWRDQAWRRRAVELCAVTAKDDVLDVACGTGDLAMAFAEAGAATVCGVDFTPAMLDLARSKLSRLSSDTRPVDYRYGDATQLDFEDDSFDIVSIAFGIRNVDDPSKALREFARVLRPGGRLVVLEFSRPENRLLNWGNNIYCGHIMPLTATLLAGDRSGAYRYLPRSVQTFLDRGAMSAAIVDAGFAEVQQHAMTFGVCVAYCAKIR